MSDLATTESHYEEFDDHKRYILENLHETIREALNSDLCSREIYECILSAINVDMYYHKTLMSKEDNLMHMIVPDRSDNLNQELKEIQKDMES
tara:strand:+ start:3125 stop:3403 length:279 start_codon:yes stop_codon:yes gene_type:complete